MGKPKKGQTKPKPVINCTICETVIDEMSGNYLVCPHCRTNKKCVHVSCAHQSKLITSKGYYYCENHLRHALAAGGSQESKAQENGANGAIASSTLNEQLDNSSILSMSPNSVITISDCNKQGEKNDERNVMERLSEEVGKESTRDNARSTGAIRKIISYPRTPNFPTSVLPASPLAPNCNYCYTQISDPPYFQCRVCKNYCHDNCPTKKERMNQIEGFWACTNCLLDWAQFVSLQKYSGNDEKIQKENFKIQSDMLR